MPDRAEKLASEVVRRLSDRLHPLQFSDTVQSLCCQAIIAALRAHAEETRREERLENMKASCRGCRAGMPLLPEGSSYHTSPPTPEHYNGSLQIVCGAAAILARGKMG